MENLLEAYFMYTDIAHQKLEAIGEFIDDTEDFVNLELDTSRNRLLRIEITITIATFVLACYSVVAGVLGENLWLPPAITKDYKGFVLINVGTIVACICVFVGTILALRHRKLL